MPQDKPIDQLEAQMLKRTPSGEPLRTLWLDVVDNYTRLCRCGAHAGGDRRLGGSLEDKLIVGRHMFPVAEDGQLSVRIAAIPHGLSVSVSAFTEWLDVVIRQAAEDLARR